MWETIFQTPRTLLLVSAMFYIRDVILCDCDDIKHSNRQIAER